MTTQSMLIGGFIFTVVILIAIFYLINAYFEILKQLAKIVLCVIILMFGGYFTIKYDSQNNNGEIETGVDLIEVAKSVTHSMAKALDSSIVVEKEKQEDMEIHVHVHLEKESGTTLIRRDKKINERPHRLYQDISLKNINAPIERIEEEVKVGCNPLNIKGPRYLVIEYFFEEEMEAQKEVAMLKANGIRRANYFWLPCYQKNSPQEGYVVSLTRPCKSFKSAEEKKADCKFEGYNRGLNFDDITILKLENILE